MAFLHHHSEPDSLVALITRRTVPSELGSDTERPLFNANLAPLQNPTSLPIHKSPPLISRPPSTHPGVR